MIGSFDFETYSEGGFLWDPLLNKWRPIPETTGKPGLSAIGVKAYAEHPSTEALCLAYNIGREKFWCPILPPPEDLFQFIKDGGVLEAVNSFFEYTMWNDYCVPQLGWPPLPIDSIFDTSAKARAYGLPGGLDKMAKALETVEQKDPIGERLIKKFSIPHQPSKKDPRRRIKPQEEPLDGGLLYGYCIQDIRTEAAVSAALPDLSPEEMEVWRADQRINARGVRIDQPALHNCLHIVALAEAKYNVELTQLTGGEVQSHAELAKLGNWLSKNGVVLPNMQKKTVAAALEELPPGPPRRALEIRAQLNSASVKKLKAIKRQLASDGRLYGLYTYGGAQKTLRWSGNGPQPQNLKASGSDSVDDWNLEAIEAALAVIAYRSLENLEVIYGDPLATIGGCVRGLFISAPGMDFICSDYSAIEAVCLAALAGEEWRLEVFRTHGKIYEMSASKIVGISYDELLAHPDFLKYRKLGKVAELASGYQGWTGAWKAFGAEKHFNNDKDLKKAILKWRKESPAIVEYWGDQYRRIGDTWDFKPERYGVEGAVVNAIQTPFTWFSVRSVAFCYRQDLDVLFCKLPSGRHLHYHQPRLTPTIHRLAKLPSFKITHMGWNSDSDKGPVGWIRMASWGGKFVENITQGTARDIFAAALVRLERHNYPVVLHSHDEPVSEIPENYGSISVYERILTSKPHWCRDWPIKVGGSWRGKRYFKN